MHVCLYMYMFICLYVHVYTCMYVFMYMYIHVRVSYSRALSSRFQTYVKCVLKFEFHVGMNTLS